MQNNIYNNNNIILHMSKFKSTIAISKCFMVNLYLDTSDKPTRESQKSIKTI